MLAYTTVSDIFVAPTALEAAVYLGGLVFLLACPYLFLGAMDKFTQAKESLKEQPQRSSEV